MKTTKEIVKPYLKELREAKYSGMASYDIMLIEKWRHRIGHNWYGFDSINELWGKIIDDFLIELEKECPDFEIHQIKLKFSSCRIYIELNCANKRKVKFINEQINELERVLQHNSLYY